VRQSRASTRHIRHLRKYFDGWRLSDIKTTDARAYIATRRDAGYRNATINRELAALKRMSTLAIEAGKLIAKPKIPHARREQRPTGVFRARPVRERAITSVARPAGRRDALVLHGWRKSEIVGPAHKKRDRATRGELRQRPLEWSRVDRAACVMRLDPGDPPEGVDQGVQGRWDRRTPRPRLPPHRRAQSGARRCLAQRRNEAHRAQDGERVPEVRYRE
jgi:hypothetical protein